jgi:RNA ligase
MLNTLEKYHQEGLLYKQVHPNLPLTIWNYTEKVQYEGLWDDITLMCRGLVTDDKGNIIARPFKKFFNMEEGKHTPTSDFEVYEKMDGSLGIFFYYEGGWVMATRGSFTSDQAVKGYEMMFNYDFANLHKDYTYLFEIIFKENRIVVNYDFEDVVLLGMVNTKTGYEVNLYGEDTDVRLKNLVSNVGLKVVKKYDGISDYRTLKSMVKNNEEGFVVRFSNGDRMKIKGEEYLRLHKIMTQVSTTSIWEVLSNGDDIDALLKDVPDEFYKKVKSYVGELKYSHFQISEYCGKHHDSYRYGKYGDKEVEPTKKEFAEFVQRNFDKKELHAVMFSMWDKKDYSSIIWKLIRPKYEKL